VVASLVAVGVIVAVVLVAGSGDEGSGGVRSAPTTTTVPPPERGLSVSVSQQALVDGSRPVVSDGRTLATSRSLPTTIWSPSTGGPYPLVVFVQGYNIGPLAYQRFCSTLASSGYVVAAPSFPLEDPSRGFGLDRSDLPNEATDVSFVITSLTAEAPALRLAPAQVGVVGHSDGADVALMTAYQGGVADPRVSAVVADAPDPMTGSIVASSAPLLLVQGTADSVVPYSSSRTVFQQVTAPVDYLSLVGADHLPPIAGGTPWTPVLDSAVADFLDATVARRGPGVGALAGTLSASPLASLVTKQ
jgi:dienelactone hydrolase